MHSPCGTVVYWRIAMYADAQTNPFSTFSVIAGLSKLLGAILVGSEGVIEAAHVILSSS